MESGSQSANSLNRRANRLADVMGMLIALLTLTLPLAMIAHYSSTTTLPQPTPYSRSQQRN